MKTALTPAEAIVIMDFSENYSFLIQSAPQSIYWDNSQATVHPIVVYSRSTDSSDEPHVQSYVVISDCLDHTTAAVSTFQQVLMDQLKVDMPLVEHVHYFSDGAASQYKNRKNFANLCYHKEDFSLDATWHFLLHHTEKVPVMGWVAP